MVSIIYLLVMLFSVLVVSSFNPVFSVIWLVMSFVSGAILLWSLGCDFLALLVIIVYVGAMAVLFLFVMMMLPTSLKPQSSVMAGLVPLISFSFMLFLGKEISPTIGGFDESWVSQEPTCIENISLWLYSEGALWVILAGVILLVALIGALILCLAPHSFSLLSSKKQDVFSQITS